MSCFNKVIIMGNLTRDPELRTAPSGSKVASVTVAVSEVWKTKDGQQQERVCFVDVDIWNRGETGHLADLCAQYLSKGSPVLVEGKLEQHEWTTKTGEKRSKLRVRADTVKFIGSRPQGAPVPPTAASSTPVPPPAFANPLPPSPTQDETKEDLPF